jgi:hypothetical protein
MAVPISNVTRRQVYAPSGSGGAGPYSFTFEILANTDIAVYKDNTLLTLTTHYTVTINANGTGSVTITAAGLALSPTSPTQYAVVGNRTIARTSDFTTGGDFFANTLNDELDQQTIFAQQNAEGLQRALQAPQTDPTTINMTLPAKATRANKTLAFDADGNPTTGVSAADVANAITYATNAANSATAAASSASSASSSASSATSSASTATTQASNASTSASNASTSASGASTSATNAATSASTATTQATNASTSASNASTSATNAASSASAASTSASNASASASSAASAQTAAEAARDSALAAYDNFDDRYLGAKSSNPTVDNDGNTLLAGALYFNTTAPEMRLWTGSAWVAAYVSGTGFVDLTSSQTIAGTKTFSSNPILSGGTANGVLYLNGSKVLTTGNALQFDGTNFGINTTTPSTWGRFVIRGASTGTGGKNVSASFSDASTGTLDIAHSSGFVVLDTQSTGTILRIDQGVGNISARFTQYGIGLSTAVPSSGTGITFPATQSASSDANTLDDYEEGTWTPTASNFTVSGTSTLSGAYTKIGRVVYFNVSFANTGTIGYSASALISLPFNGIDQSGMIAMWVSSGGVSQTSNKSGVQMQIDAANTRFFLGNFTTTSAGETLFFGGFYRVS